MTPSSYGPPNAFGARARMLTFADRSSVVFHPIDCEHCGGVRSCENVPGDRVRDRYTCKACGRTNFVEKQRSQNRG